jgi:hypothetical protein
VFLPGTSADSTSPARLVIRRSKLAHGAVDGAVRQPAIDRLVVVLAVADEAASALGDDVEDIDRPDLKVLRASEAKNCDLRIEIGGRMEKSAKAVTRYSSIRLTAINAVFVPV